MRCLKESRRHQRVGMVNHGDRLDANACVGVPLGRVTADVSMIR